LWEVGSVSELIVYVDKKGRVLIPSSIRRQLNIRNVVKIVVEEGQIVLKPVEDPLMRVERLVVKGTDDVEAEIRKLHKIAEDELQKGV